MFNILYILLGECERDGAYSCGTGVVPRRAAARGGGAAVAGRRGLPGAGDHQEPCEAARAVRLLGTTQTLHRANNP